MAATAPQPAIPAGHQFRTPRGVTKTEFTLVLACCAQLSEDARERALAEIGRQTIDWDAFVELADEHGVISQVVSSLATSAWLPDRARTALAWRRDAIVRRSLWLTSELLCVLAEFEAHGIEALPYKGPVLAQYLYGDVTQRQFSDLDVLIRRADVARARAVLMQIGLQPGISLSPTQEHAYLESGYEYTFDSTHGKNLLELQWQVLPHFYAIDFDVEGFFRRSVPLRLVERPVRSLSPEDLALVLCAHAAKHAWIQLSWLLEIGEMMRLPAVSWYSIQQNARDLGIARIVSASCLLAHRLLAAPLPEAIRGDMDRDPKLEALFDGLIPLVSGAVAIDPQSTPYFQLMLRTRERWQDRGRFLWRLATTPSVGEWNAVRLPGPLSPLYRAVRLGRVAARLLR